MKSEQFINIARHIKQHIVTTGEIRFQAFKGGASNLTFSVKDDKHEWIMRTSPPGTKAQGAHNMEREYNLLKNIYPTFSLCPKVILLCQDSTVFEREFYLMKPINGIIIRKQLPAIYQTKDLPILCQQLIQVHHRLHQVPTKNLQQYNKGQGYIGRQISGWIKRYQNVAPEKDLATEVMKWLLNHMPEDVRDYTLIHNDYKFDNVVFDSENPTKIIGVLDWELTTIGDPLMDLGCSLAYWFEANDHEQLQQVSMMPTHRDGMLTRDELVHQYALLSGLDIDNYHFYYVYGLFRLAVIVQQIYYRYEHGQTDNPVFKPFGLIRDLVLKQALKQLN